MSIQITQGDVVTLSLTAKTDGTTLFNLTGATFESYIYNEDNEIVTIANGDHTAAADQSTDTGEFTIDLDATQTASLKLGKRELVTKVTQGPTVTHFHGVDAVEVLPPLPRY